MELLFHGERFTLVQHSGVSTSKRQKVDASPAERCTPLHLRCKTFLIVFDWDNTLRPSTIYGFQSPKKWWDEVLRTLDLACLSGQVVILSNATQRWIDQDIQRAGWTRRMVEER